LIAKAVLVSALALLITGFTVLVLAHPGHGNVPGEVILDVIFVLLAVWVDRYAIRRWRQTAAGFHPTPIRSQARTAPV
jgi:hypothetical protein